jgi:hypothetical protein
MVSRVMIWNKTFERFNGNLYPVGKSIISSQYSTVWAESITLDITVGRLIPHLATGWRSTVHPSGRDLSWNVVRTGFDAGRTDVDSLGSGVVDSVISVGSGISITMGSGVRQMQLTHPKQTIIVAVCLINFILIIFS